MRPDIDEYFISIARLAASRSTCVRRAVGCVLVNSRNHVLATGYNGVASGEAHCNATVTNLDADDRLRLDFPHACPGINASSGQGLDGCYAVHAEQNAILQCQDAYTIDRAYVTAFPCPSCAKLLLNTTCRLIVYDQAYGDDAGRALWIKAGRLAQQFDGPPHMIQADLLELFSSEIEGPIEQLSEWRVVVACVCLNLCSARAARPVIFRILQRWPTPDALSRADTRALEGIIRPLGLSQKRVEYLCNLSAGWMDAWPDIGRLPGVGAYAMESVRVFCRGAIPENHENIGDRKVAAWVEWFNRNRRGDATETWDTRRYRK